MNTVDVRIEGIAAGGAGVGRLPDGRAVFVHRTAPGDDVAVLVTETKRRWARARLISIRTPGAGRRDAPCSYYARCGGCTIEHLRYDAQLRAKAGIVAEALRRIGGREIEAPVVVASPDEFRYRNRVAFTLRRLAGGRVVAGFHEIEQPGRVLDIDGACLLPELLVSQAWDQVRANWGDGAGRLPAGDRLRLTVRAATEGQCALLVEGGRGRGRPEELLARAPLLAAVWHRPDRAPAPVLLAGRAVLEEIWTDEEVAISGGVFLQVNRKAAALLEDHVIALAGEVAELRVIDAYCGVGLHARRLARIGARVIGIERDAGAVAEARRSGQQGLEVRQGAVEDLLSEALPAHLVIVNPPRAGLAEQVSAMLRARPPHRLIYISCDPATLARDLDRLGPHFALSDVRCFDLFPQTAHVETVAELTCAIS